VKSKEEEKKERNQTRAFRKTLVTSSLSQHPRWLKFEYLMFG